MAQNVDPVCGLSSYNISLATNVPKKLRSGESLCCFLRPKAIYWGTTIVAWMRKAILLHAPKISYQQPSSSKHSYNGNSSDLVSDMVTRPTLIVCTTLLSELPDYTQSCTLAWNWSDSIRTLFLRTSKDLLIIDHALSGVGGGEGRERVGRRPRLASLSLCCFLRRGPFLRLSFSSKAYKWIMVGGGSTTVISCSFNNTSSCIV